jgi:hypothetical protein
MGYYSDKEKQMYSISLKAEYIAGGSESILWEAFKHSIMTMTFEVLPLRISQHLLINT